MKKIRKIQFRKSSIFIGDHIRITTDKGIEECLFVEKNKNKARMLFVNHKNTPSIMTRDIFVKKIKHIEIIFQAQNSLNRSGINLIRGETIIFADYAGRMEDEPLKKCIVYGYLSEVILAIREDDFPIWGWQNHFKKSNTEEELVQVLEQ